MTITWLRHGRSSGDDEGVHEGRYDAPLTEVGRAQATARAATWQAAGGDVRPGDCKPADTSAGNR